MVAGSLKARSAEDNCRLNPDPSTESLQEKLDDEIGLATLAGIGVAPA